MHICTKFSIDFAHDRAWGVLLLQVYAIYVYIKISKGSLRSARFPRVNPGSKVICEVSFFILSLKHTHCTPPLLTSTHIEHNFSSPSDGGRMPAPRSSHIACTLTYTYIYEYKKGRAYSSPLTRPFFILSYCYKYILLYTYTNIRTIIGIVIKNNAYEL